METLPREMVSRRKILSRSRDDLNLEHQYQQQDDEEDIWYQKDKLYKVSTCLNLFVCAFSIRVYVNKQLRHTIREINRIIVGDMKIEEAHS